MLSSLRRKYGQYRHQTQRRRIPVPCLHSSLGPQQAYDRPRSPKAIATFRARPRPPHRPSTRPPTGPRPRASGISGCTSTDVGLYRRRRCGADGCGEGGDWVGDWGVVWVEGGGEGEGGVGCVGYGGGGEECVVVGLGGGGRESGYLAGAVHERRLIVCDERTDALDHETGQTVMELLRKVAVKPDRAVIVVTHDNRVFHFGDRIARMDDGRIVEIRDQIVGASTDSDGGR